MQIARQLDLLAWTPPEPVLRFAEADVRAPNVTAVLARAVSASLQGHDRGAVADGMGDFLGARVSRAMLDAYASQARADHAISAPRFWALVHATGDRRLLELMAARQDWAVVERRHLPLIELASLREHQDDLERHEAALRRRVRAGGLL